MRPEYARIQVISLLTIAAILVGATLKTLSVVMIPLVLAIMLSYILSPIVDWSIQRFSIPKWLGISAALLFTLFVLLAAALLISSSLSNLSDHSAEYEEQLDLLSNRFL